VIYIATLVDAIHVLHAFQKKSQKHSATWRLPPRDYER
jgi:phage-related protein